MGGAVKVASIWIIAILLAVAALSWWSKVLRRGEVVPGEYNAQSEEHANMTVEQLRIDVSRLALPQGRMVGTAGHESARSYLLDRLQKMGVSGYADTGLELPYEVNGNRYTNLIGKVAGANPALAPALLAAHYDTCGPFPGADDNAAAIAILLALAERWSHAPLERTVVFAFFDAEEPPSFLGPEMGSIHFYHHQRTTPIHCAVVLDLVGHDVPMPGLEDLVFVTGMESNAQFAEIIESSGGGAPIKIVPALNRYIGDLSDHHIFRINERPYLFFSCAHWEHYHQPTDTHEKLNYEKMAALGEYLAELTEKVCGAALDAPFEGYDSTPAELRLMRRAIGPLVESMGFALNNRRDIDRVVMAIASQFGL
ncbi:MAG: M28 family peptidase [Candidatus Hydrogenedentes bacterium]|nr:M28 family peptidase [Candidatus Hydrogenedentota bacterium]